MQVHSKSLLFVSVVYIGTDILDHLCDLGFGFQEILDTLDGVEDGGVVAVAKHLTDLRQGQVGHLAGEVHGDVARRDDLAAAGRAASTARTATKFSA